MWTPKGVCLLKVKGNENEVDEVEGGCLILEQCPFDGISVVSCEKETSCDNEKEMLILCCDERMYDYDSVSSG